MTIPWIYSLPFYKSPGLNDYKGIFVPCALAKEGDIKTHSFHLSVHHKNINLAHHIFWSINEILLIFGTHDPCDKPFQVAPCYDFYHLPISRWHLFAVRGTTILQICLWKYICHISVSEVSLTIAIMHFWINENIWHVFFTNEDLFKWDQSQRPLWTLC